MMTIDVDAVYENGILTLKHRVDLPENAEVHVTIQTAAEARTPLGRRLRELRAEIARSGMLLSVGTRSRVKLPSGAGSSLLPVSEEK